MSVPPAHSGEEEAVDAVAWAAGSSPQRVVRDCLNVIFSTARDMAQVLVMVCFPLFSYAGVVGTASGMVDLKDMKPLLNRLRPSSRELMVGGRMRLCHGER